MSLLRGERGQTSAEFVGITVLLAAIVTAIAALDLDGRIADSLDQAICQVLGDEDCEGGEPVASFEPGRGAVPELQPLDQLGPPAPVPSGYAIGPGGTLVAVDPTGIQADPVNSRTGAFETQVVDAALPGPGPAFSFTRSYSSDARESGPLGPGWSHRYAAQLELAGDGSVEIAMGDGQRVRYPRAADGSYLELPGIRATLRRSDGGWELTTHDQITWAFDRSGRLSSVSDRNRNRVKLGYDDEQLTTIDDPAGRQVRLGYDGERLSSVELPDGREVRYSYDGGYLREVTDLAGDVTEFDYDSGGHLESITDGRGTTTVTNRYGDDGRVVAQVDGRGNRTAFAWDPQTQTQTMTDPLGGEWRDTYRNGALVRREDPLGNATYFDWESDLDLAEVVDARGSVWRFSYDADHNLVSRAAPREIGHEERFEYDADNDLVAITDGEGHRWRLLRDARGNAIGQTTPAGTATKVEVNGAGQPTAIVDPLGRRSALDYDEDGNLVSVREPGGDRLRIGYDDAGRLTSFVDPRADAGEADAWRWRLAYNARDQLTAAADPLGNSLAFAYDERGQPVGATDAKRRVTRWSYDEMGNLTTVEAPDGSTTGYAYDAANRLTAIGDANSGTRTFIRDAAGRPVRFLGPSGERFDYRWDEANALIGMTDANGNASPTPGDGVTELARDSAGRLTAVRYSDESTPDVRFSYDGRSFITGMSDAFGTDRYRYDSRGLPVSVTRGSERIGYRYDEAAQLVRRGYPGFEVDYRYDSDGELAAVSTPSGTTELRHDAAGNLTAVALANGASSRYGYDRAGRLELLSHRDADGEILARSATELDPTGNPVRARTDLGIETYAYDERDRLVSACLRDPCEESDPDRYEYSYDPLANLTSLRRGAAIVDLGYDDSSRLESVSGPDGDHDIAHDANGNLTAYGELGFEYDGAGRIVGIEQAGDPLASYRYDGLGRRLRSRDADGSRASYLWDPNFDLAALAVRREAGSEERYAYGEGPVSVRDDSGESFLHPDGLGSVLATTAADGEARTRTSYEPYGSVRVREGRSVDPGSLAYTGQPFDPDSGLLHLRARDYLPELARFPQVDPIPAETGEPARSPYAYVDGRPTVASDPSGQIGPLAIVAGAALLGGAGNAGVQAATSEDERGVGDVAGNFALGGITGGTLPITGPLGGTVTRVALPTVGRFGSRLLGAGTVATGEGAAGAIGTTANTAISEGRLPSGGELVFGAGTNAAGGFAGGLLFPFRGVTTLRQVPYFMPRTPSGFLSPTQANTQALYGQLGTNLTLDAGVGALGAEDALAAPPGASGGPAGPPAPGFPFAPGGGAPPLVPIGVLPAK